jgi:uncharacterized membrane protein
MMNSVHPSVSILHLLTSRLHVPVSRRAMSAAVEAHSQPFSLACLRQALAQWRVDSLAVQLPAQDLAEVPLPAIAHLHSGNFVLLTRAEAGRVVYQDVKGNTIKASLTDFDQAWSGKLLLAEAQAQAGEPTYRQSRYQEQLALARNITCWVLLVALFLWPVWLAVNSAAWAILVWWVSKVAGLATSILLLLSQLAPNQGLAKRLCDLRPGISCQNVLTSQAATWFGFLSMTDLGLLYFGSGVLAICLGWLANIQVLPWLALLNLLALPYTVFSIWYQWRVVKSWCPLCLAVQALLWLEFGAAWWGGAGFWPQPTAWAGGLTSGALAAGICLVIRPLLGLAGQVAPLRGALAKFKYHPAWFRAALLEQAPLPPLPPEPILLGNAEAKWRVVMFSSPHCPPCGQAHQQLKELLTAFPEEVSAEIYWTFTGSPADQRNRVVKHLLALAGHSPAALSEALTDWYKHKNYPAWAARYPCPTLEADGEMAQMGTLLGFVQYTPLFFVNGHQLPEPYQIRDLTMFIAQELE